MAISGLSAPLCCSSSSDDGHCGSNIPTSLKLKYECCSVDNVEQVIGLVDEDVDGLMVVNNGGVVEGVSDVEWDVEMSMVEMTTSVVQCWLSDVVVDGCNVKLGLSLKGCDTIRGDQPRDCSSAILSHTQTRVVLPFVQRLSLCRPTKSPCR